MITCDKKHLIARCHERGYRLEEVMPCVIKQDGDQWTIDTASPHYPQDVREFCIFEAAQTVNEGAMTVYRCRYCGSGVATSASPPATKTCPVRKRPESARSVTSSGPGTELKKLLGRIGIKATPTCSCNRRAREMDEHGIQWCRENLDLIAGEWLAGEAKKRKLPYSEFAGRKLVQLAIALAERAAAKAGN